MTSGGSRLTELRALTVMPRGWPLLSVVTTVTPVTKWPMTARNVSGATDASVTASGCGMRGSLREAPDILRPMALTSHPFASIDDLCAMQAAVTRSWLSPRRPLVSYTPGDLAWWFARGEPGVDWGRADPGLDGRRGHGRLGLAEQAGGARVVRRRGRRRGRRATPPDRDPRLGTDAGRRTMRRPKATRRRPSRSGPPTAGPSRTSSRVSASRRPPPG